MKKGDLMCVSDLSPSCVSSHTDVHLLLHHMFIFVLFSPKQLTTFQKSQPKHALCNYSAKSVIYNVILTFFCGLSYVAVSTADHRTLIERWLVNEKVERSNRSSLQHLLETLR